MATAAEPLSPRAALRAALYAALEAITVALNATKQASQLGVPPAKVDERISDLEAKLALIIKRIQALGSTTDVVAGPTDQQVAALRASVVTLRNQNVTAAAWKGIVEDALAISAQVLNFPAALPNWKQPRNRRPKSRC